MQACNGVTKPLIPCVAYNLFNFRPGPWDRLSLPRGGDSNKPGTWDPANRNALSDWNKYSGIIFLFYFAHFKVFQWIKQ